MTPAPFFSILVPVCNSDLVLLQEAIRSVQRQAFRDWELILVDDKSPEPLVVRLLRDHAASDPRIVVIEQQVAGGVSATLNAGLAAARGAFVGLLEPDAVLGAGALRIAAEALSNDSEIDFLYTDEDRVDAQGRFSDALCKPDWSPERLRSQMYTRNFSVYRRSLIEQVGGFRSEFDGAHDHDLALRATEVARRVHHVPEILYHARSVSKRPSPNGDAQARAWDASVRAVDEHVRRIGVGSGAVRGPSPGTVEVLRPLDPQLRVSVVIPTRGASGEVRGQQRCFVVEAVRGLLAGTAHENLELVVVHDSDTSEEVLAELRRLAGAKLVLIEFSEPFNFSAKCNLGAVHSTGDVLVMLNDDIEPISRNALEALCAPLQQPDVGLTGGYLVYEDGRVQHAGHQYAHRNWGHPYQEYTLDNPGPFSALDVDREVAGVTAACSAIRRSVFFEVGGFTEALPNNFNDVDFCYKVRAAGYRILWISRARMYHFESRSRVSRVEQYEVDVVRARWGIPDSDPFTHLPSRTALHRQRAEYGNPSS